MKEDYIENQAKNQIQQSIFDALTGSSQTTEQERCKYPVPQSPSMRRGRGRPCKGPPGRSRSPGVLRAPNPGTMMILLPELVEGAIQYKRSKIKYNTNSKFLQTLKFFIMKKQILFLAMFTLALIFAGTKSYGQDLDHLDAVPTYCAPYVALTCGAGDALSPLPGVAYDYTIGSTSVGKLHWFVTDDANIITTQGAIAAGIELANGTSPYILTANAAYNDPDNTSPTVNITWKSFDGLANNVILVVYNTDDVNCTDNMEVYRIEPKYSFSLDIAGIADSGTSGGPAVTDCANPIQTATYNGATQTLTVDYGTDYVFFAVNAANWMTSWMPGNFTATGGGSTVTVDGWAYPADAATTGAWKAVGTDPVLASAYPAGISDNGFVAEACIIVRVRVEHGTAFENLADETINLTVNGMMLSPVDGSYIGYPDLDEPASGTDCINDLTTDNANYVITPRPTVTEVTPTPFEDKIPN